MRGLQGIGDAVAFEGHERLRLRTAKATVAQGGVFGAEGVDLLLEVGDFGIVSHAAIGNAFWNETQTHRHTTR